MVLGRLVGVYWAAVSRFPTNGHMLDVRATRFRVEG